MIKGLFRCMFIRNLFHLVVLFTMLAGCTQNSIDRTKPEFIEDNEYQVEISDRREIWNHSNILQEPRLNFVLENSIDKTKKISHYSQDNEVGIYSLRLDGSDFRTIISPMELRKILGFKMDRIKHIKRSHDNRYLALKDGSYLHVIDLAGEKAKKITTIQGVKDDPFYWIKNEPKLLYQGGDNKLIEYHVETKDSQDISPRFRAITSYYDYEYYGDLNRIIFRNKKINVHNYKTGGLLERSPREYYYGEAGVNPYYRIVNANYKNNYAKKGYLSLFPQGEPQSLIELPYKIKWEENYLAVDENNIFRAHYKGLQYDSIENEKSQIWMFGSYHSIDALTVTRYQHERNESDHWDHEKIRPEFSDRLNEKPRSIRLSDSERVSAIDEIIKEGTVEYKIGHNNLLEKYYVSNSIVKISQIDKQVKEAKALYAAEKYQRFAKNILNVAGKLEKLNKNDSQYALIMSGDKLFQELSYHEITTYLAPAAQKCLVASEAPFEYLISSHYQDNLKTGIGYGSEPSSVRKLITGKLEFLVPNLIRLGFKSLAKDYVDKAHDEFSHNYNQNLVLYLIDLEYGYQKGFDYIDDDEYNAVAYLKIYDLVGDENRLKDLVRNTKEEINSRTKSKYNTLERRMFYAKQLSEFYLFQGKKNEAYKLLKKFSKENSVVTILDKYDDRELFKAFTKQNKKAINNNEAFNKEDWLRNEYFEDLLHDYGDEGVSFAYKIHLEHIRNYAMSWHDATGLKLHVLNHMVKIKHPKYPEFLKEMTAFCDEVSCGSRYEDMWILEILRDMYAELGNKERVTSIIQNMKDLEQGKIADLSEKPDVFRSLHYYRILEKTATPEEFIAHFDTYGGNSEIFRELFDNNKESEKALTYLIYLLKPKYWDNRPGEYIEDILPRFTSEILKDKKVMSSLAETSCGLLFGAYNSRYPDYLSKINTSL